MPIFRYKTNQGTFEIESNRQLNPQELKQTIGKREPTPTGLPGYRRTEELIAKRRPAIETLREELAYKPKTGLEAAFKPPTLALKGLGLVRERGEAAVAGPLAELQEAVGRPIPTTARRAGEAFVKGLRGERRIELGDIPRRAGFPEPLSAAIGLGTAIKLIDIPAQKIISRSISRVGKGIKNIVVGDKRTIFNGVKDFVGGLDDVLGEAGNNVGKIFKGAVGRKPVNINEVNRILRVLPQSIRKKLLSRDAKVLFGIRRTPKGGLVPTKNNIWKVRRFLDDLITPREFQEGATRVAKQNIFNARQALRGVLERGDEGIRPIMNTFSKLVDDYGFAKSSLITKGRPVLDKFLRAVGGKGEIELQDTLRALAQFVPKAQRTINQAVRFNRAQILRKVVGGGAAFAAGAAIYRRPITRAIEGIGGAGPSPQAQ